LRDFRSRAIFEFFNTIRQDRPQRSDLSLDSKSSVSPAAGPQLHPTRRDKTYPPIAFQPDHACGIYRETQESRYAFAVFKSAVSKLCVPKTLSPAIVVMKSTEDGA
jgi:hypothetical protein